ncbi:hypothetical protein [Clostridium thailandense]|uniref:hypothetical protein n=1 Tax=Clostridium thailandense TaxID=2794346 RepID=UPI00398A3F68
MNKLKECPECGSKEIKQGKLFGEASRYLMLEATYELAYDGTKPMLLVNDVDNK